MRNNHRYIARIVVEAQTPLFVGSGDSSLLKDALIQKDYMGLPMIPGTSLAGVLRHSLEDRNGKNSWGNIFGYQDKNEGLGSRLRVSSAYFLLGDGKVAEGLEFEIEQKDLQIKLENLPVRQHVRINDKGVAVKGGLFDNEVVYKGARFIFEIELIGNKDDKDSWDEIEKTIKSPAFRIGQGTRNGYGILKVTKIYNESFDLRIQEDFESYLNFNASFNSNVEFNDPDRGNLDNNAEKYTLELEPDDFFIFSDGFGDEDVKNKPVREEVMVYQNGKIDFVEKTLIPASSIKGAIAHRVAFHYNRLEGKFADQIGSERFKNVVGENNLAVAKLFGKKGQIEKDEDGKDINIGRRGILLIDDLYYDDIVNDKIFNHVAIDRFTGGAIDGALFSEKVSRKIDGKINLEIHLFKDDLDDNIKLALEESLKDICKGLLPLGGMTTKGFGMFTGKLSNRGAEIFNYDNQKTEVQWTE